MAHSRAGRDDAGVFGSFDYAPCSMLISQEGKTRRLWVNVSQEGRASLDDLRENGFCDGLKLSTEDFQAVRALRGHPAGAAPREATCVVTVAGDGLSSVAQGHGVHPPHAKGHHR